MYNDPSGMKGEEVTTQGQQMQLNLPPTASGMYEVPTVDGNSVYQRPQGTAGFSQLNPIVLDEVQPEPAFQSSDKIGTDFYYYHGKFGWANSGISIGSPYSKEALDAAGLMTKKEAIAYNNERAINYKIDQQQAIIEANREGAEMYAKMQNPAFMAAYTAYQLHPSSLAVSMYNNYQEGNNKTLAAELMLMSVPIFGRVGKVISNEVNSVTKVLNAAELKTLRSTEVGAQSIEKVNDIKNVITGENPIELMYLQREPIYITTVNDVSYILDGHHRIEAFSSLGKDLTVIELSNTEALKMFKSKTEQINKGLFK